MLCCMCAPRRGSRYVIRLLHSVIYLDWGALPRGKDTFEMDGNIWKRRKGATRRSKTRLEDCGSLVAGFACKRPFQENAGTPSEGGSPRESQPQGGSPLTSRVGKNKNPSRIRNALKPVTWFPPSTSHPRGAQTHPLPKKQLGVPECHRKRGR